MLLRDVISIALQDALLKDMRNIVLEYCASTITYERPILRHNHNFNHICCSPDSKFVISRCTSSAQVLTIHELETGRCIAQLEDPAVEYLFCIDMDHTGLLIASAWDKTIGIWDAARHHLLYTFTFDRSVWRLQFSPTDSDIMAVKLIGESRVRVIDSCTGDELRYLQADNCIWSLCWSHDGEWLAAGTDVGSVFIWDISTGHTLCRLDAHPSHVMSYHAGAAPSLCFSPDRTRLVSVTNARSPICVWSVVDPSHILLLYTVQHDTTIASVTFTPNGLYIAAACGDQFVRLWWADTGILTHEYAQCARCIIFTPDGAKLLTESYHTTCTACIDPPFAPRRPVKNN